MKIKKKSKCCKAGGCYTMCSAMSTRADFASVARLKKTFDVYTIQSSATKTALVISRFY